jgi:hypothetical protein
MHSFVCLYAALEECGDGSGTSYIEPLLEGGGITDFEPLLEGGGRTDLEPLCWREEVELTLSLSAGGRR